ncbi:hypothetical protein D9M71_297200 [compost metagenome]
MLQLARHRLHRGTGRAQCALVEVAGMGDRRRLRRALHLGDQHLRFGNIRQPALQTDSQTAMPGHEQQQAEAVEQGMEQRQLEQGVVAQAEPGGDLPGQRRQGRNQ